MNTPRPGGYLGAKTRLRIKREQLDDILIAYRNFQASAPDVIAVADEYFRAKSAVKEEER